MYTYNKTCKATKYREERKNMIIDTTYKISYKKNGVYEYHTFTTSLTEREFMNTLAGVYDEEVLKTLVILEESKG